MKDRIETSFLGSSAFMLASLVAVGAALYVWQPQGGGFLSEEVVADNATKQDEIAKQKTKRRMLRESPRPTQNFADEPMRKYVSPESTNTSKETSEQIAEAPVDSETQLNDAISLIDSGDPEAALTLLEKILKQDPNNEKALVEMAMVQVIDFKAPSAAVPYLERALQVNPDNGVVVSELMAAYEDTGNVEGGLSFLENVYNTSEGNPNVASGIGQMLVGDGRPADAIPYLEKAVQKSKNAAFLMPDLADAYAQSGQGDKALATYDQAIEREKSRELTEQDGGIELQRERVTMLQINKARELLRQDKPQAAEDLLRELQAQSPDDRAVMSLLDQVRDAKRG